MTDTLTQKIQDDNIVAYLMLNYLLVPSITIDECETED